MTAKSFTEAFAAAAEPVDLDAIEARLADDQPDEHYILRFDVPVLIAEVKRLRSVNESTTGWAVTLEGQAAKVRAEAVEARDRAGDADDPRATAPYAFWERFVRELDRLTGSTE